MSHSLTVVVTGGAGFIGSHLVDGLLRAGHQVTVLDDFSTGFKTNLPSAPNLKVVEGSILDSGAVGTALSRANAVFHLAAIPSVPRSIKEPLATHEVNATGTLRMLEECRSRGIVRFVYAASSSAQGDLGNQPRSESILGKPQSPYGIAKLMGELYGAVYHNLHAMEVISLRYFNVYGPRQRLRGTYTSVIPRILDAAVCRTPMTIYGDGLQTRDFTYVDDVVRASLIALGSKTAPGHTINVCSGSSTTVLDLIAIVSGLVGRSIEIDHLPARSEDIYQVRGDPRLAGELLGFTATTTLKAGLHETLEWFRLYKREKEPATVQIW